MKLLGVVRIGNQQLAELRRIVFGDAGGSAHDRRHSPAQRFAHRQPVGFIARGMNQRVERRKNLRHVGSEAGEPDPVADARLLGPPPPGRQLGALPHDYQVGVPVPAAA